MEMNSKVLILYTGGTIGMVKDLKTGRLVSFDFNHLYTHIPELERLPITLESISLEKPIDSSEINRSHWQNIGRIVLENYHEFDGFVILHGSDTMAFTASVLSFMVQGLNKPIILTGSQLPIGTIRTDGKENLITAIEIAGAKDAQGISVVQEVAVYFEYSLLRGNRSSKISANQFDAFASPNYPKLAVAGVNIEFQNDRLFRSAKDTIQFSPELSDQLSLIKLFPGMNFNAYSSIFKLENNRLIILETFGSGNASSDVTFRKLITQFIAEGGIVLNVTQCSSGSVQQGKYETSSFFEAAGVISGKDLTTEAALTKSMHLLGVYSSQETVKKFLKEDLVGEMTV